MNTDNAKRFDSIAFVTNGVAKVAVPTGHYSIEGAVTDTDRNGEVAIVRQLAITDFSVKANRSVSLLARNASAKVAVRTPKAVRGGALTSFWDRTDSVFSPGDALGHVIYGGITVSPGTDLYLQPAPAAKVGALHEVLAYLGIGKSSGGGFAYDLRGVSSDVPKHPVLAPRQQSLAVVRDRYYGDPYAPPGSYTQQDYVSAAFPGDKVGDDAGAVSGIRVPGTFTFYLSAEPKLNWYGNLDTGQAQWTEYLQHFHRGRTVAVDWAKAPTTPQFPQGPTALTTRLFGPRTDCTACIGGSTLDLYLDTATDSVASHLGAAEDAMSHYVLSYGGQALVDQRDIAGATVADAPTGPLDYTLDYGQRLFEKYPGAPITHTLWSFPPNDSVPVAYLVCSGSAHGVPCRVLPMLLVRYDLPLRLGNTSTGSTQSITLHITHLSYDGVGSRSPIARVHLQVAPTGSSPWQRVKLKRVSNDTYTGAWTNPTAGSSPVTPALRISAADSFGSSIRQQVLHAYVVPAKK